ncbi:hypothetical protein CEP10_11720 [Cylindrospermopsis raciborskii S07]|uniref:Uncharacterized protein n=2 Tax=Cylindrospermopsis raciborskii TaxID=77022 RepID=A0A853MFY6_9CYAN|nr:hypothetical protein A9P98_08700 [Cylindrospermopsis raciborskii CS-505]OHY32219.1 hypothetical protein BCV63_07380 [Cylindrospermopsis raciborskii CS-508]PNJ93232.1 hypothetical protein CEP15_15200 [Cylindrospermopsis raciborskii C07]PNJ93532.1 hypothetical protein CEP14_13525 [Cylindrospermopsis raciborskii C04]PNJ94602.1 hypothetical protein CEP13_10405 [Cylindrospermopsis raciborskii C03]PNK03566.1 hypothetical protein CEP12_14545 [Cylindrospermopsis raciborskii S14]PNK04997.1 hypothet
MTRFSMNLHFILYSQIANLFAIIASYEKSLPLREELIGILTSWDPPKLKRRSRSTPHKKSPTLGVELFIYQD